MNHARIVLLALLPVVAAFHGNASIGADWAGASDATGLIRPGSTTRCFATLTGTAAGGEIAIRNTCPFNATAYVWAAVAVAGTKKWSAPGQVSLAPGASGTTGFERATAVTIEGCPGRAYPVKPSGAPADAGPPSPYLCHP